MTLNDLFQICIQEVDSSSTLTFTVADRWPIHQKKVLNPVQIANGTKPDGFTTIENAARLAKAQVDEAHKQMLNEFHRKLHEATTQAKTETANANAEVSKLRNELAELKSQFNTLKASESQCKAKLNTFINTHEGIKKLLENEPQPQPAQANETQVSDDDSISTLATISGNLSNIPDIEDLFDPLLDPIDVNMI